MRSFLKLQICVFFILFTHHRGKAIEHYEKFLTLWKEADPGIAEIDDATKRMAGLKSY